MATALLSSLYYSTRTVTNCDPPHKCCNAMRPAVVVACKTSSSSPAIVVTKRGLAISVSTLLLGGILSNSSNAAILEADDDVELLEKVKRDRKKRIERQEVINSSNKEAGYVQEIVYKLSKVGQAIENNDLATASSVLGSSTDADWVKKGNVAFNKLSANSEEKTEADVFNSSLSSLISSVGKNDVEYSKAAFVSSASALEKWAALTGLAALLKGL
ncbi:hypothetical protein ACHQM5_002552 [Ranunculus cassubicifolius]